jgi:retron-type reverse transcriptase/5S rRNA maturation endonuclease (ribonuclease M5)
MYKLQTLKNATTLHDVAELLGFKPKALSYILYHKAQAAKYRSFTLAKANGGQRLIQTPSDDLKLLQRNLSDLLQDCAAELNLTHKWKDQIAHGFKRERSIITNASRHRGKRWVFNIDLEDFFGTINFGRVWGFFIKNQHFALNPKVATVLAQIACHDNALPQGSPCSPVISNLVAHILDAKLVKLAAQTGCTYTRYADDLTFSTNLPSIPTEIAVMNGGQGHDWLPGNALNRIITKSGYSINPSKTRLQYRNSRQNVTGLVVNKKVNIPDEYRRKVRAMVHSLFTNGDFHHKSIITGPTGQLVQKIPGTLPQLHGMLGFIDSVDLYNKRLHQHANIAGTNPKNQMRTKESQYRLFLMFEYFYNAQQPIIICEGKTDNVYMTEAIKRLAAQYPSLASVSAANVVSFKIRIFKYPDTSTGRILGLHGGSGDLKNFIRKYNEDMKKFMAPGLQQPVIVLLDNDSGGRDVGGVINSIVKKQITWNEPFLHVTRNLYVMATPLIGGAKESAIEDFFSPATLGTVLSGKTFQKDPPIDLSKHYVKATFAEDVIKKNSQTIDFRGFKPLLDNLAAILADYAAKQVPKANP